MLAVCEFRAELDWLVCWRLKLSYVGLGATWKTPKHALTLLQSLVDFNLVFLYCLQCLKVFLISNESLFKQILLGSHFVILRFANKQALLLRRCANQAMCLYIWIQVFIEVEIFLSIILRFCLSFIPQFLLRSH